MTTHVYLAPSAVVNYFLAYRFEAETGMPVFDRSLKPATAHSRAVRQDDASPPSGGPQIASILRQCCGKRAGLRAVVSAVVQKSLDAIVQFREAPVLLCGDPRFHNDIIS